MPSQKGEIDLVANLTNQLIAFLSGCWGDFVIEEMPKVTRPQKLLYIWGFVRDFLVAVLPLGGILIFQQTIYAQPINSIVSSFVWVSLIWMIVRLIGLLSPSALDDVGKVKDITALFSK